VHTSSSCRPHIGNETNAQRFLSDQGAELFLRLFHAGQALAVRAHIHPKKQNELAVPTRSARGRAEQLLLFRSPFPPTRLHPMTPRRSDVPSVLRRGYGACDGFAVNLAHSSPLLFKFEFLQASASCRRIATETLVSYMHKVPPAPHKHGERQKPHPLSTPGNSSTDEPIVPRLFLIARAGLMLPSHILAHTLPHTFLLSADVGHTRRGTRAYFSHLAIRSPFPFSTPVSYKLHTLPTARIDGR